MAFLVRILTTNLSLLGHEVFLFCNPSNNGCFIEDFLNFSACLGVKAFFGVGSAYVTGFEKTRLPRTIVSN